MIIKSYFQHCQLHVILLSVICMACAGQTNASERADHAWRQIRLGAKIIDVRTPSEFASGHLAQATNIPLNVLDQSLAQLKKDEPVVLYCQSGRRAEIAKHYLHSLGYRTVINGGGLQEMQTQDICCNK